MTEQETLRILAVLKAAWPDRTVTRETAAAYHCAWADLPYAAVDTAARRWLQAGTFFPAPSELRALVVEEGVGVPPAEVAWQEVRGMIAAVGHAGIPAWSNPVLAGAVAALGWRAICLCEEDALGTLRAQFRDTYDACRRRFIGSDAVAPALAEAARRRPEVAAPAPAPALPEAHWDATAEARYRAQRGSYVTQRLRRRHETQHPHAQPGAPPDMLALLQTTPGWALLPEEYRARLLARRAAERGREPTAVPAGGGGA